VALIASEKKGYGPNSRDSMYILNPDGELTKLEEPSKLMKHYAYFLLPSPDGRNIYWANSNSKERYVTNLDNMESKRILKKVVGFQDMHISPSGKYIVFLDNSYRTLNGCFIYNVADDTLTKIMPEDGSRGDHFCGFGNHWSPTEDKLFGITRNGYALLNVPDGKITTFPGGDADSCRIASWMPDGKHIFLSLCTTYDQYGMGEMNRPNINTRYQDFIQSIGARLMNISDGKVTKYPDGGFCEVIISPDSKWVLFYACKNQEKLIDSPSKMLNLDTKEMVPIFTEFVSKRTDAPPDQNNQYFWSVTWLP